jgi:enoyl-CoA hydratase/carnithine racemase
MLEHAVYAVISPEGCASILWRSADKGENRAADAAEAMKVTAADCKALGVIDTIVPEPLGGAHRDPAAAVFPRWPWRLPPNSRFPCARRLRRQPDPRYRPAHDRAR